MQEDWPALSWYRPLEHGVHSVMPDALAAKPGKQTAQDVEPNWLVVTLIRIQIPITYMN